MEFVLSVRLNFTPNFMARSGETSPGKINNSIPQKRNAENDEANTMKELLQKAWLFGAGVFDFTKDKVEALVQDMVRRGEITQQESTEAVKQMLAKAQEAQQGMVAKVKELTKSAVDEIKVAKASDLAALEARVAALEEELKKR
jgi:polyhydroxyalkanoate synthesis regulator phasin